MKTRVVSAMEYEALLNVERMLRVALVKPNVGDILVGALLALDKVRKTEGGEVKPPEQQPHNTVASAVGDAFAPDAETTSLIERVKKP
jgi:hypothetical protein